MIATGTPATFTTPAASGSIASRPQGRPAPAANGGAVSSAGNERVKIKLKRLGKIREPHYRIVVADSRTKRDGRAIEEIGKYYPKAEPSLIEVNSERAQHWLSVGAQPTDPVRVLLKITGDWRSSPGSRVGRHAPDRRAAR